MQDHDKITGDSYDSTADTLEHIATVQGKLHAFVSGLANRALKHDLSKLNPPEKEAFDEATPKLRGLTYGSDEYKAATAQLGEALKHHYAHNSHHPEHFENGISGMSLLDVVEMLADWKAATERHDDGDIRKSLEFNRERFGIDDQLYHILANTLDELKW